MDEKCATCGKALKRFRICLHGEKYCSQACKLRDNQFMQDTIDNFNGE